MGKAKKSASRRKQGSRKKASSVVRRGGPKKLPRKQTASRQALHAWVTEVGYVFFSLITVFIVGALLSFHFSRVAPGSALIHTSPSLDSNIMGSIGHVLATALVGFLGYASYGLAVIVASFAVVLWMKSQEKVQPKFPHPLAGILGIVGCLYSFTLFVVLLAGFDAGGLLGLHMVAPVIENFGGVGASLLGLTILLISIGLLSRLSSTEILVLAVQGVWRGCLLTASIFARAVTEFFILTRSFFMAIFDLLGAIMPLRSIDEDELEPLPKLEKRLKRKKPSTTKKAKSKRAKEDSEILVSRRGRSKLKKRKNEKIKLKRKRESSKRKKSTVVEYQAPDLDLLSRGEETEHPEADDILRRKSRLIESKLNDFSIAGRVTEVHPGPVITLFEFEPAPGVKVGKIASLQDDLAMSLRANAIRIIAPIPKKGTVGIEVPNRKREIVRLRDVLESDEFLGAKSTLTIALGKNTYGDPVVTNISKMPHLLIAGATGTGKSVCINALLLSLLYRASPQDLGLILIDPKILELSVYEGIPHLRVPVVTRPKQARAVLEWAVQEMDKRYRIMHKYGVRSIDAYNSMVAGEDTAVVKAKEKDAVQLNEQDVLEDGNVSAVDAEVSKSDLKQEPTQKDLFVEQLEKLPKLVIVIDELADLMLSVGREIEDLIARLAQKARAAGIHLIVATQRPSVDVITGLIKANFPARLSFRVSSRIDSRTILDSMGAEKLLGMGDMLLMFPGAVHVQRLHGAFVSDSEVKKVIQAAKSQSSPMYDSEIVEACERALIEDSGSKDSSDDSDDFDPLYDEAVNFILKKGKASTSMLQRAFRIGYNRAARIIDIMEREGVVGPVNGAKPREILINTLDPEED